MALTKISRSLLDTGISDSSDATAITIDSSENVGIGTTSPASNLHLSTTGEARLIVEGDSNNDSGEESALIEFKTDGGAVRHRVEALGSGGNDLKLIAGSADTSSSVNSNIIFETKAASASATEAMRIDSSGNVGIGCTDSQTPLEIDTSTANYRIQFTHTGGQNLIKSIDSDHSTMRSLFYDALEHVYQISGTEKMRIDSSGAVGISETAPNNALLHLNQTVAATSNGSSDFSAGTNLSLWIENSASSGYPRIFNKSDSSTVSVVTNYEDGKHAYWGEPNDTRTYYFRGGGSSGVSISGSLAKGSGSFKIEHPLESKKDTHNLVHSFIEGPQADLIYRGVAVLENGTASINLDTAAGMTEGTFVLLNTNTSCFTSNESDWDAVKGSVSGNILTISCQNTSSTAKVSWMVIGERQDQHMIEANWTDENGKVIVEPLKDVNA